jgi:Ca-activated chloride channel homolog
VEAISVTDLTFGAGVWRFVAAIAVVTLAVAYALDFTRRRRAIERVGHLPQLRRMMPALSEERRAIKAILLVAGVSLTIVALAQPQVKGETRWQKRGIDLVVVMDFSESMLARDVRPSRFERMKREVIDLIDDERLAADRVAVVVFAGGAAHFPLTHDHEAAKLLFDGLTPLEMPAGSDVGLAVRLARCVVQPNALDNPACSELMGGGQPEAEELGEAAGTSAPADPLPTDRSDIERSRAIVIFTDGEDTESRVAAEIKAAAESDIEIFVVGVGTPSGELIPEFDSADPTPLSRRRVLGWKRRDDGSFVFTRLEEGRLRDWARLAGGDDRYVRTTLRHSEPDELVTRLEKLKKGDLDQRVVKISVEVYQWLLFPAFMFLVIEACIGERRRRARP